MPANNSDVRPGSFCNIGDRGTTAAGTPMECTGTGDGKRARWRKAAGAVSASRVRKREPRTPQQRAADKLRPSELTALRVAGGWPQNGPLPRQKRQYVKLADAGFLDGPDTRMLTAAGRDALRRRNAIDDTHPPHRHPLDVAVPAARDKPAPVVEDRSVDAGTDWSEFDACRLCVAGAGQPCRDLGRPGSFNATPHPGRPKWATRWSDWAAKTPAPVEAPAPTPAPAATGRPDAAKVREDMKQMTDVASAEKYIDDLGLNRAQLKTLADDLGIFVPAGANKQQLRNDVVQWTCGRRLASQAIRRPNLRDVGPAADQPAPVDGRRSSKDPTYNTWGDMTSTGPIHFHGDGVTGQGLDRMGADRRMDVDGEPLADAAGRVATRVVRGEITPQRGWEEMSRLRDRIPAGTAARAGMDEIVAGMGAPDAPPPVLPEATPEPIRRLVDDLHRDYPVVRSSGHETGRLVDVARRWVAGDRQCSTPIGLITAVRSAARNVRHESDSDRGKIALDKRVEQCVRELEDLRRTNRQVLFSPRQS